ncbi:hypothetical protein JB92DRAFT_2786838 [Gautieria morchelliformis]|nr:hypothetical protein JB92DRAFT_2786838 [Gautieria morchelliformis]
MVRYLQGDPDRADRQVGKSCILTVSRPNGLSRSYRTKAEFTRNTDAKIAAASSAIKLGAVNFIRHGDTSAVGGRRGLVLAKLDAGVKKDEGDTEALLKNAIDAKGGDDSDGDRAVAEIEKCCFDWRAGSVIPRWVFLVEKKISDAFGCALKISLSSNVQRTYSVLVSIDHPRKSLAKAACAKLALEQGVIEFIKHGDGLKEPIVVPFVGAEATLPPTPPTGMTLQAFHAALPKPLPDQIGTKSSGESNAVAWLNTMVQTAKGSRMTVTFHWYMDTKIGLHGCLLRLSRPDGPSQSYLVDALFSKRADAKLAVCLLACSQGLGDYVRGVVAEIEARVSTEMRRRCADEILPALGQSLYKVRHGLRPELEYTCDLSTFGCTLSIDLSSDADSETPIKRQWNVPLAYKSKVDAKVAVMCAAADDGLMDFVKYRGQPPPTSDDHASSVELVDEGELEEGETMEGPKKKKTKKARKDGGDAADVQDLKVKNGGNMPLFETREEARARGRFDAGPGKRPQQRTLNGRGRGAGFSRHGMFGPSGFRGGFSQSGHAPARRRPLGGPGGYPAPHPNFPQYYPPPHSYSYPYAPGAPGPFPPHPVVPPAGELGFPGGAYPLEYEHHGYFLGDRESASEGYTHGLGRGSVNTATSFTHAPPPGPASMMPVYHEYHERDPDYVVLHDHEDPSAQPSHSTTVPSGVPHSRPFDDEYRGSASDADSYLPPHAVSAAYEVAGRLAQGHSHAYELGHYAPDYDRNADRSAVAKVPPTQPRALRNYRSDASSAQTLTARQLPSHAPHSQGSAQPAHAHGHGTHAIDRATPGEHNRQPNLTPDRPTDRNATQQQDSTTKHALNMHLLHAERLRPKKLSSRRRPVQTQANTADPPRVEDGMDGVTSSGLQTETVEVKSEDPRTSPLPIPSQVITPRTDQASPVSSLPASSGTEESVVPSKRGRSADEEDTDSVCHKRARVSSRSRSRGSNGERAEDLRDGSSVQSTVPGKSVPTEEQGQDPDEVVAPPSAVNNMDEKGVSALKQPQGVQGNHQMEICYVDALLEQCGKDGLPSPEFCYEKLSNVATGRPFKVWVIMGKERLELPTSFPTVHAGNERVARSVLGRLKVQSKQRKET